MADKRFYLPDQERVSMSGQAADKLIRRGDGLAALCYLFILKNKGNVTMSAIASALSCSEKQAYDATAALRSLGLLAGGEYTEERGAAPEEKDELSEYTSEDVTRAIDASSDFAPLVKEAEAVLGRVLNTNDLKILLGLYDQLNLPAEVVLLLIAHCVQETLETCGPGKKTSMRGVEKVAFAWSRNGIGTLDAAHAYLKKRQAQKGQAAEIAQLLGLRNDPLTDTQKKYIYGWLDMGFDSTVITLAYDKTVVNTGELKWPYINRILSSWHEMGLHTRTEIEQGDRKTGRRPAASRSAASQAAPDRAAVEQNRKFLENMRREAEKR